MFEAPKVTTIIFAGLMVDNEFAVAAFVHPRLRAFQTMYISLARLLVLMCSAVYALLVWVCPSAEMITFRNSRWYGADTRGSP
jgi:hypothetical protein